MTFKHKVSALGVSLGLVGGLVWFAVANPLLLKYLTAMIGGSFDYGHM